MMSYRTKEEQRELPIGFLDSGLGGISVLREAVKVMPCEHFLYYGDSKNAPYGTKSQEEIREHTFRAVDFLLEKGIKALAVACNTATSAAVAPLRVMYPEMPLVGIEPAIRPAVMNYHGGRILVMATPMTIAQEKYQKLLAQYQDQAEIISVPCGGLMEFAEAGKTDCDELTAYYREYVGPYLTENTESIVLGCTHYPLLKNNLRRFLGNRKIELIDGSFGTAMELRRRIIQKDLLRPEMQEFDKQQVRSRVTIYNSSGQAELIDRSYELLLM